jgi:hypothetical protein
VRWCAPLGDQSVQDVDEIISGAPAAYPHRERLAGVLVDDVGQLQPPAVGGLVELEVDRPDVVGPLGLQPLGDPSRDAAAFARADRAA